MDAIAMFIVAMDIVAVDTVAVGTVAMETNPASNENSQRTNDLPVAFESL